MLHKVVLTFDTVSEILKNNVNIQMKAIGQSFLVVLYSCTCTL